VSLSSRLLETLDTDEVISPLLEAQEPDHEFEPGKGPKVRDEHIVKLWKVVPGEIAGFVTDKGTRGILVKREAYKKAPYHMGASLMAPRGFWVYTDHDLAALAHAQPKWKTAYEAKTGHRIDVSRLPYWYKERLQAQGKMPLESEHNLKGALKAAGWRLKKEKKRDREGPGGAEHMIKRFGGIWVSIPFFTGHYGSDRIFISPSGLPRGLPYEQWKDFHADTRIEFKFRGKYIEDIEKAAQQVAAKVKKWKPKRAKLDQDRVRWYYKGQVHTGKAALDRWKTECERIIMDDILRPGSGPGRQAAILGRRNPCSTTQSIVNNILHNYGLIDIEGVNRKRMSTMIRTILNRLAKQGKIDRTTGGRHPEWCPKD
jgi:hypothetical protein